MIASSDPLARRGCSRAAFSTDCMYASVGLSRMLKKSASVKTVSREASLVKRISLGIRAYGL